MDESHNIFGAVILLLSISGAIQAEVCSCTSTPNCKDLSNDRTTKIPETTTTSVNLMTTPVNVTSTPVNVTTPPVNVATTPVNVTTTPVTVITNPVTVTTTNVNVTTTPVPITTMALDEYKCCLDDSELQCCKGPQDCRPGCEVELKNNSVKCIKNIPSVKCYLDLSVQGVVTCSQKKPSVTTNSPSTLSLEQTPEQSLQVIKAIVATLLALFILVVIGAVIVFFVCMKRNQGEAKRLQNMTIKNDGHELNDYSNERLPAANSHTSEDSPVDLADAQDPHYDAQRLPEHAFHNEAVNGRQFEDDDEENYMEPSGAMPPRRLPSPQSHPEEQPYANMSGLGHY